MLTYEADVKKYFADIFMDVVIDKAEGYAYLKQKETEGEESDIPHLIENRQLSFHVSLLCLLLRNYLIENDRDGGSTRAILSKETILALMKPFYKETTNEAKQTAQIEATINKVIDEGFLRPLKNEDNQYEINRIMKAFINGDVVKESLERLQQFVEQKSASE